LPFLSPLPTRRLLPKTLLSAPGPGESFLWVQW
jgi:hypothetical protein